MKKTMKKSTGFTLTEILVVVVILGVIASLVLPAYHKVVEQNYERTFIRNLKTIHAAEQAYYAEHGKYWPNTAGLGSITLPDCTGQMNTTLDLNVIDEGSTYNCTGTDGSTFGITVKRMPGNPYTLEVDESALNGSNPCCQAGSCPTLPSC